jgi:hypothetical protein
MSLGLPGFGMESVCPKDGAEIKSNKLSEVKREAVFIVNANLEPHFRHQLKAALKKKEPSFQTALFSKDLD